MRGIPIKRRSYFMKVYDNCWIGKEALSWGEKNTEFEKENLIILFEFYRKIGFFV